MCTSKYLLRKIKNYDCRILRSCGSMLSTKYLVLIAVLVAAALGLGHDLKTLLSKYNANCDVNQLTCKSSFGVQCCTDPLVR